MVSLLQRVTFLQTPKKVTKKRFAPPLGASLRLGMPALRPSWLTGPADQDQKHAASLALDSCYGVALLFCRSWLAGDAGDSVHQVHPVDAIAGKPAPTGDRVRFSF
jgi:hypothetical protein